MPPTTATVRPVSAVVNGSRPSSAVHGGPPSRPGTAGPTISRSTTANGLHSKRQEPVPAPTERRVTRAMATQVHSVSTSTSKTNMNVNSGTNRPKNMNGNMGKTAPRDACESYYTCYRLEAAIAL